ncbi:LRR receptor-like serine/threonine-protein kinase EFR [Malania oleifera]|uniref:LRR receptor-like serine/threonine-protein kinase EFR n=1 Tax=Malania oleifera TaxID=397392 RepID=UPI0025AD9E8A|nr:LRR receptor-like serine/threonine-protein kinase EFR [Malania oleifera]
MIIEKVVKLVTNIRSLQPQNISAFLSGSCTGFPPQMELPIWILTQFFSLTFCPVLLLFFMSSASGSVSAARLWTGVTYGFMRQYQRVSGLDQSSKKLSGTISPHIAISITNLSTKMTWLTVGGNSIGEAFLEGISNLANLIQLCMQGNFFTGNIPTSIGELSKLTGLSLEINNLTGQIPPSIGSLSRLIELVSLSSLTIFLNLSDDSLTGNLPPEVGSLTNLVVLDISNKKFSGEIPSMLGSCLALERLNMQGNLFEGVIPYTTELKNIMRKLKKPIFATSFGHVCPKVSYEVLRNATGGFYLSNLVGSGSFGRVYKGILGPDEANVAIKVPKLEQKGASKSFMAVCEALRNIRHRNLVKVLTACSRTDFEGNEFKALVYEFMPNGSLETWLHPEAGQENKRNLTLLQRINIAIGVAFALHYLHHECQTPIVHCDLKPSNVLLDDDLNAHVSDFGLERILSNSGRDATFNKFSSLGIKGTIQVTLSNYNYLTKRPIDEPFKDGLNLHEFAKMALQGRVRDIVDQAIIDKETDEVNNIGNLSRWKSEGSEILISKASSE